jgi:predicted  nucleic acid-binding Zn-ribbon protein
MRYSRDDWKNKATVRAEEVRELKKTKSRHQEKIQELKDKIGVLEKNFPEEKK